MALTLWLLYVFKSFLWKTLEVLHGISNLLFLHMESSLKVCQSWYQLTKALSLLQDVLFICAVIDIYFRVVPLTFSGVIYQVTALCLPRSYQRLVSINHISLLVWWNLQLKSGMISFCVFSWLFLKYFWARFIVFNFWPVRIIILLFQ